MHNSFESNILPNFADRCGTAKVIKSVSCGLVMSAKKCCRNPEIDSNKLMDEILSKIRNRSLRKIGSGRKDLGSTSPYDERKAGH